MMRVCLTAARYAATSSIGRTVAERPMRCGRTLRDRVEPRQSQGQMRSAFVVGDGVDLIDDHGAHGAQHLARSFRGQQNEQRFRGGDQNVRRFFAHALAVRGRRIAGANGGSDGRERHAAQRGELRDLGERRFQIALHIVRKRFQRRNVDDVRFRGKGVGARGANEAIEANQKRGERFA